MRVEVTVIENSWNPTLSMFYVWDNVRILTSRKKQNANKKFDATRWTLSSVTLEMYGFYHQIQNRPIFENNAITTEFWQHLQLTTVTKKCA